MALRDYYAVQNAVRIGNALRVELGHSIRRFMKLRVHVFRSHEVQNCALTHMLS